MDMDERKRWVPANEPWGRENAVSWIDSSGNLWLFGGWGMGGGSTYVPFNDCGIQPYK